MCRLVLLCFIARRAPSGMVFLLQLAHSCGFKAANRSLGVALCTLRFLFDFLLDLLVLSALSSVSIGAVLLAAIVRARVVLVVVWSKAWTIVSASVAPIVPAVVVVACLVVVTTAIAVLSVAIAIIVAIPAVEVITLAAEVVLVVALTPRAVVLAIEVVVLAIEVVLAHWPAPSAALTPSPSLTLIWGLVLLVGVTFALTHAAERGVLAILAVVIIL